MLVDLIHLTVVIVEPTVEVLLNTIIVLLHLTVVISDALLIHPIDPVDFCLSFALLSAKFSLKLGRVKTLRVKSGGVRVILFLAGKTTHGSSSRRFLYFPGQPWSAMISRTTLPRVWPSSTCATASPACFSG